MFKLTRRKGILELREIITRTQTITLDEIILEPKLNCM